MRRNRSSAAMLAACLVLFAGPLAAQAPGAPSERAQRDADKVFQWIKIHSDKPRRVRDEKEPKPAAAPPPPTVTATTVPRPAARPAPEPAAQRAVAATAAPLPNPEPAAPAAVEAMPASAAVAKAAPAVPAQPPEPVGDDPLVFVRQVEPEFPRLAMRMLGKGSVQVRFEVKPDGTVGRAEVVKTSSARLNQAAVDAVAQWRFQPLHHAQIGIVDLGFNLD